MVSAWRKWWTFSMIWSASAASQCGCSSTTSIVNNTYVGDDAGELGAVDAGADASDARVQGESDGGAGDASPDVASPDSGFDAGVYDAATCAPYVPDPSDGPVECARVLSDAGCPACAPNGFLCSANVGTVVTFDAGATVPLGTSGTWCSATPHCLRNAGWIGNCANDAGSITGVPYECSPGFVPPSPCTSTHDPDGAQRYCCPATP